jgi:hypothetical protein
MGLTRTVKECRGYTHLHSNTHSDRGNKDGQTELSDSILYSPEHKLCSFYLTTPLHSLSLRVYECRWDIVI